MIFKICKCNLTVDDMEWELFYLKSEMYNERYNIFLCSIYLFSVIPFQVWRL